MFRSAALTLALCLAAITAQGALVSRAGGQAYYDTDTNLTWVADANLAQTLGYDADGQMSWSAAQGWIATLNAQNAGLGYLGTNDWRLPTVTDIDPPGCPVFGGFNGADCGYNVDLATGEMARMFYGTLGNTAWFDTGGVPTGCGNNAPIYCMTNVGPFGNFQFGDMSYWYGTENAAKTDSAWAFSFTDGLQGVSVSKNADLYTGMYAWAVRPGDIAAVPLPGGLWLLGTALAGLCGRHMLRRKVTEKRDV